jgi:hypothetical protein
MTAALLNNELALVVRHSETTQVMCWDRGRPARNAPKPRKSFTLLSLNSGSRFALIAGGTPAVPANHLTGFTETSHSLSSILSPVVQFVFQ